MFNEVRETEVIKKLSQKELYYHLYLTQGLFLACVFLLSVLWDQEFHQWKMLFSFDWGSLLVWTFPTVILVVGIDLYLWRRLPKGWTDDGGINKRIFASIHPFHLLVLTFTIGVIEETLFRGLLQVHLGYLPASLLFALMHIRYLRKPVLFSFVMLLSFMLGGLFIQTNNLLIPIIAHFLINLFLGSILRFDLFSTGNDRGA